jgi:hypothetical protein
LKQRASNRKWFAFDALNIATINDQVSSEPLNVALRKCWLEAVLQLRFVGLSGATLCTWRYVCQSRFSPVSGCTVKRTTDVTALHCPRHAALRCSIASLTIDASTALRSYCGRKTLRASKVLVLDLYAELTCFPSPISQD